MGFSSHSNNAFLNVQNEQFYELLPKALTIRSTPPSQVANIFPHRCFPSLIIVIYIYFQPLDDSSLDYKVMHGL